MDVIFDFNFQQIYDVFKVVKDVSDDYWEMNIGNFMWFYFEVLVSSFKLQNFDSDEMMREVFVEVLEKGMIVFRVVEQGKMKVFYNECVFEDGVFYMQVSIFLGNLGKRS